MLLGSPPDMVHRAPAHGAHIRMQNSAIYSPVRFKYYTIPFGKLQVAVGGWGRKFLLKRFERQYRIILSADTASEVRQMLSQKRR